MTTDPGRPTLPKGTILERRYMIEDLLAVGGMAEVYVARHTVVGRQVALKLLKPEFARDESTVERFMNEARAAGMLGHPHIAECADAGYTDDAVPYLVLELMKGMSLRALIDVEKQLPEARAVAITMQIASALEMAHHNSIIHRDLKPENIFIVQRAERDEFVKVLDFGISKFSEHGKGATVEGRMLGTPDYMSPEQINHAHTVDSRCDVWALGVTLYEMLTGAAPFGHLPFPHNVLAIETELVPDVRVAAPQVSEGLAKVIGRMLERDLDKRIADMRQVFQELAPFAGPLAPPKITAHRVEIPKLAVGTQPTVSAGSSQAPPRRTPYPNPTVKSESTTAPGAIPIPSKDPAAKSSTPLFAVLGVVAVAAAGLGYYKLGPGSAAPAAPSASGLPAPTGVKLTVAGTPGMTMLLRGQQLTIPHEAPVNPGQVPEVLELSAPGHTTLRYRITVDRPLSLQVELPKGTGARDATPDEVARAFGMPLAAPTSTGAPTVESGQVSDLVKKNKPQVQACIDAVPANVELKAPILLKGTVDAQGVVTALEVETTPTQQKAGDCIKNAFKTWHFPAADGVASRAVTYKFKFE